MRPGFPGSWFTGWPGYFFVGIDDLWLGPPAQRFPKTYSYTFSSSKNAPAASISTSRPRRGFAPISL